MTGTIPLISVVIPCFNDEKYVEKAVQSVLDQSYKEIEIIIVDDGSDLPTKNVLEKLQPKISLLITQENLGQGAARNKGIKQAKGKYILNLDSDDYFKPTFCAKAIEAFAKDGEITIVTCQARRFSKQRVIDVFTPKGGYINDFLFSNSALGSSMFKKSDWERVGGYDESPLIIGYEDWEFYIQLLKYGGYAYVIHEMLFNYQVRTGSTTNRIKSIKQEKYSFILLKHQDLYKNNFEALVNHLSNKILKDEEETYKRENSLNFKIGKKLLLPFRKLKSIFY